MGGRREALVRLAGGFGVPGVRVETAEALAQELARAVTEPGPHLIEALLARDERATVRS